MVWEFLSLTILSDAVLQENGHWWDCSCFCASRRVCCAPYKLIQLGSTISLLSSLVCMSLDFKMNPHCFCMCPKISALTLQTKKMQGSLNRVWAAVLFGWHPFFGWHLVPAAWERCKVPRVIVQHSKVGVDGNFFPELYWKVMKVSIIGENTSSVFVFIYQNFSGAFFSLRTGLENTYHGPCFWSSRLPFQSMAKEWIAKFSIS